MSTKHMPKRPRDPNQLAKLVVDIATGEAEDGVSPVMRDPESVRGRAGGLVGGKTRARILSGEKKAEIAKKAAQSRWKTHKTD